MARRVVLLLAATMLVTGCSRLRYSYAPVTTKSAEMDGHSAAIIAVPPDDAKGELRIASLGVANVTPPSDVARAPFRALFVRFVVVNESTETWGFDAVEQRIEILEGPSTRVISWARTATGERPPLVPVPAHTSTSLDILFPIGKRDEGDLSRFEVRWSIRQGARLVDGRAEFRRHLVNRELTPETFEPAEPPPYRVPARVPAVPLDPCLP